MSFLINSKVSMQYVNIYIDQCIHIMKLKECGMCLPTGQQPNNTTN